MANQTLPSQSVPLILPTDSSRTPGDQTYQGQLQLVTSSSTQYGPTSAYPTSNLFIGRRFFDTTLNAPVIWNGTMWVNSSHASNIVAYNSFLYGTPTGQVGSITASNGQILIGSTGSSPVASSIIAGPGITITVGPGTIEIETQSQPQNFIGWGADSVSPIVASPQGPFFFNTKAVEKNITFPMNINGMSVGPVTINTGISVVVPTGSSWKII